MILQEDNKSLETDLEMREIMEIAVNNINSFHTHTSSDKEGKEKYKHDKKKTKMHKNGPNRKPSNKTCNTVTKTTLDIIIVDIAKDIMVDIA